MCFLYSNLSAEFWLINQLIHWERKEMGKRKGEREMRIWAISKLEQPCQLLSGTNHAVACLTWISTFSSSYPVISREMLLPLGKLTVKLHGKGCGCEILLQESEELGLKINLPQSSILSLQSPHWHVEKAEWYSAIMVVGSNLDDVEGGFPWWKHQLHIT